MTFQRLLELLAEDRDAEALYALQQGLVPIPSGGGNQFRIAQFNNIGGGVYEAAAGSDPGITMETHAAAGAFRFAVDTWDDAGDNFVIVQGGQLGNAAVTPTSKIIQYQGGAEGGDFSFAFNSDGTPFDPQVINILYRKMP